MFASMLGTFLSLFLIMFVSFAIMLGIISAIKDEAEAKVEKKVEKNSVLEIRFNEIIKERSSDKFPWRNLVFRDEEASLGLDKILSSIERAGKDENIKGIYLNITGIDAGIGTVGEIRNALQEFKESGKFIISYSEFYSLKSYYLSSVADKIYLNPEGYLDFRGLHANPMFFKGTLEKLDIEAQIIRHGKYKSAVEPFMLDKMSEENREQVQELISSIWNGMLGQISASRNIPVDDLSDIANNLKIRRASDAVELGMADELAFYDQVESELKKLTGREDAKKLNDVSLAQYSRGRSVTGKLTSKNKIAIIYAVGSIEGGSGDEETIGSETISRAIRKARTDSSIKAIVLRVNSPGGSALASDVIWREVTLAREAKPFVVSMGDVAASGGYYIACAADTIVCEPNTITGSIGVLGVLFNMQKMFSNKLGITFDTVKTGRFADILNQTRPLTEEEKRIATGEVERIYQGFVKHVSEGRNMSVADVDSVGQGRVWSGVDAKRLGLIDVLGGINDAVDIAAKMASLDDYKTVSMPEYKDILERLLDNVSADAKTDAVKKELGDAYPYYRQAKDILKMRGIQTRMPMEIVIE